MGKLTILTILFVLLGARAGYAQPKNHRQIQGKPKLSQPPFLQDPDRLLTIENGPFSPDPPSRGADQTPLSAVEDIVAPEGEVMDGLTNEEILPQIGLFNRTESESGSYFWHLTTGGDFCHFRDFEGNHWYGWEGNEKFHWVLWRGGQFWWHDNYARRWLIFSNGNWWWSGIQATDTVKVYLDGSYFACDGNGMIVSTEGERPGAIVSGPGPFQGDSHHGGGHHGGWHGPGSEGHQESRQREASERVSSQVNPAGVQP